MNRESPTCAGLASQESARKQKRMSPSQKSRLVWNLCIIVILTPSSCRAFAKGLIVA